MSTEKLTVGVNGETEGDGHGGSIERDGHMPSRYGGSVQREMDICLAVMAGQNRGRRICVSMSVYLVGSIDAYLCENSD